MSFELRRSETDHFRTNPAMGVPRKAMLILLVETLCPYASPHPAIAILKVSLALNMDVSNWTLLKATIAQ